MSLGQSAFDDLQDQIHKRRRFSRRESPMPFVNRPCDIRFRHRRFPPHRHYLTAFLPPCQ